MSRIKRRKKYDGLLDRRLMTAAIVSTIYLRGIRSAYSRELLEGEMKRFIFEWCIQFFDQYGKAPSKEISALYEKQVELKFLPPDVAEDIGDFLATLSEEFEESSELNIEYLIDQTLEQFQAQKLKKLRESLEIALEDGDTKEAVELVSSFRQSPLSSIDIIEPLADINLINKVFDEPPKSLLVLHPTMVHFVGSAFSRGNFVGFMGKFGVGKTWTAMELAMMGLLNKKKVLFVQAGDLSAQQQEARWLTRITGCSILEKYSGKILLPVLDCKLNQSGECDSIVRTCGCSVLVEKSENEEEDKFLSFNDSKEIGYTPCTACTEIDHSTWWKEIDVSLLTREHALKAAERFRRAFNNNLRMVCRPSNTLSLEDIIGRINLLEDREGFIPDIIVIDSMDLLKTNHYSREFRHQQNELWKNARGLSEKLHCCIIGLTQADADSYNRPILQAKNFSEDRRKLDHVTNMFGLNQTDNEKFRGVIRWNEIKMREDAFEVNKCLKILQCIQIGRPILEMYL